MALRSRTGAAQAGLLLVLIGSPSAAFTQPSGEPLAPLNEPSPVRELSSQAAAQMANWVIATSDNGGRPFIVIDKISAKVLVFDAAGQMMGSAPALLGITRGDDSAPGIGDRELRNIPLQDRTTPAGRFVAKYGPAAGHSKVLWVDYASALSLHPVVAGTRKERRLQRLNSPATDDNRITYGCINVPTKFYARVIRPLFSETTGVIYILPETRSLKDVFRAL